MHDKNHVWFFQDEAVTAAAGYSITAALIDMVNIGPVIFLGEQGKRLFDYSMSEMSDHGI